MGIAFGCVALDCPDAWELAEFYGNLLGWEVDKDKCFGDHWVALGNPGTGPDICFQRIPGYRAPTWPVGERPQMLHLDFDVADIDAEHDRVLSLGATLLDDEPETFRVYADPVGHPFCLVRA